MDAGSRSPFVRRAISDHGQDGVPPGLDVVVKMDAKLEKIRSRRANSDPGIFHQLAVGNVPQRNAGRTETKGPMVTDLEQGEVRNQVQQLTEGRKMAIQQLEVMSCRQNSTASAARSVIGELQVALAEMREQQNCMRQDNMLMHNSLMEQERAMAARALETERRDKLLFPPTQQATQQLSMLQEEMASSSRTPDRVRTPPNRVGDSQQRSAVGYDEMGAERRPRRKIP